VDAWAESFAMVALALVFMMTLSDQACPGISLHMKVVAMYSRPQHSSLYFLQGEAID